ncbi:MAG: ATP-dependent Clp protease ATP-binding subunit [bacterium]|nr:ATP-dependent Clp protease ATP-binding subunit [bacterium]
MKHESQESQELYYREPRLEMTTLGRFGVRLALYAGYAISAATAVTLLLQWNDVPRLFWAGVLLSLFLFDRLMHIGEGEWPVMKLPRDKPNVAMSVSPSAYAVLEHSYERANALGGDVALWIAGKLLERKEIQDGLTRMDVPHDELRAKVEDALAASEKERMPAPEIREKIAALAVEAFRQAALSSSQFVGSKDIFAALAIAGGGRLASVFRMFSIQSSDLENALIWSRFRRRFRRLSRLPSSLGGFAHRQQKIRHRIMNRAWTARPTPTLDRHGTDFTDLARSEKVGFLIGHEKEYDRLADVLSRQVKPSVLLVGAPGTGKETIVAHLAFEIIKDRVPAPLFDKRLVALQIGSLVAGAEPAELQDRVQKIVDDIVNAGNVILFIPDIHNLVLTSGAKNLSAADVLLPAITGGAFQVIGATYPREFKQLIEPQSEFLNAFEVIRVEEIKEEEAVRLMVYESIILEAQHDIIISFGAVKEAVRLVKKYFRDKPLPASAQDLLKEALADSVEKGDKVLDAKDIIRVAERKVNIPIHPAGKEEAAQLLNLEPLIHERLVDQDQAVGAVARSLREYRSGLSRKGGPIAAFLFVGPTGVGKTELSKILARIQFGSEEMMVRFDMSEYQDKQSISRLIGSPHGEVSGALTDTILQRPYSLILLDEFEKAHPDILNVFLQVFDDGRLTDNLGRTVDFQNTIIIATSNAHSEFIKEQLEQGKAMAEVSDALKKKLTDYFRPELINRFSDTIVFKNLSPDDTEKIAALMLKDLAKTVGEAQGITLNFSPEAVARVAELGYSPVFGARPLRNVISEKLRGVLAEKILRNEISRGGTVRVDVKDGGFIFK